MLGGLFLAAALVAALVLFCAVAGVVSLVLWLVLLPFRLLGFVFRGLAVLLMLPLILLGGLLLAVVVGIPVLIALAAPLLPIALVVAAIVWLARRGMGRAAHGI